VRELRSLRAHYEATLSADGIHNLAFQLWLVSSAAVQPSAVRAEVMVWVANSGMSPAGARIDALEIDGGFDLYRAERRHDDRGVERAWTILTLVARRPRLEGAIDLGSLLIATSAAGGLDPDLWLANVDFGTEIAGGAGRVAVRGYRIEVD
jgi:hypothetical protein